MPRAASASTPLRAGPGRCAQRPSSRSGRGCGRSLRPTTRSGGPWTSRSHQPDRTRSGSPPPPLRPHRRTQPRSPSAQSRVSGSPASASARTLSTRAARTWTTTSRTAPIVRTRGIRLGVGPALGLSNGPRRRHLLPRALDAVEPRLRVLLDERRAEHLPHGDRARGVWSAEPQAANARVRVFPGPRPAPALRRFTAATGRSRAPRPRGLRTLVPDRPAQLRPGRGRADLDRAAAGGRRAGLGRRDATPLPALRRQHPRHRAEPQRTKNSTATASLGSSTSTR